MSGDERRLGPVPLRKPNAPSGAGSGKASLRARLGIHSITACHRLCKLTSVRRPKVYHVTNSLGFISDWFRIIWGLFKVDLGFHLGYLGLLPQS